MVAWVGMGESVATDSPAASPASLPILGDDPPLYTPGPPSPFPIPNTFNYFAIYQDVNAISLSAAGWTNAAVLTSMNQSVAGVGTLSLVRGGAPPGTLSAPSRPAGWWQTTPMALWNYYAYSSAHYASSTSPGPAARGFVGQGIVLHIYSVQGGPPIYGYNNDWQLRYLHGGPLGLAVFTRPTLASSVSFTLPAMGSGGFPWLSITCLITQAPQDDILDPIDGGGGGHRMVMSASAEGGS